MSKIGAWNQGNKNQSDNAVEEPKNEMLRMQLFLAHAGIKDGS